MSRGHSQSVLERPTMMARGTFVFISLAAIALSSFAISTEVYRGVPMHIGTIVLIVLDWVVVIGMGCLAAYRKREPLASMYLGVVITLISAIASYQLSPTPDVLPMKTSLQEPLSPATIALLRSALLRETAPFSETIRLLITVFIPRILFVLWTVMWTHITTVSLLDDFNFWFKDDINSELNELRLYVKNTGMGLLLRFFDTQRPSVWGNFFPRLRQSDKPPRLNKLEQDILPRLHQDHLLPMKTAMANSETETK